MALNYYFKSKKTSILTGNIAFCAIFLFSAGCSEMLLLSKKKDKNIDAQNALIGLLALSQSGCAQYAETPISNTHYTGGARSLYIVSACDTAGWSSLGFNTTSSGGTQTLVSSGNKVITTLPYSGYGTNIEVTFTVTNATGTLDVMAYGTGTFPGQSTTNPTLRILAGASCSLQFRSKVSPGDVSNVSTCTDTTYLSAGQSYTYCLEFDRGDGAGGLYPGFSYMLAAWSKPCSQVTSGERTGMGNIKLMQMMNIPDMNPVTSGTVGFNYTGITLQSFKIGNTIYQ